MLPSNIDVWLSPEVAAIAGPGMTCPPKPAAAFAGIDMRSGKPRVCLPTLREVAYQPTNPDRTPKNCANCTFWQRNDLCTLHPRNVLIAGDMVCNRHTFGRPTNLTDLAEPLDHHASLDPRQTNLRSARGGAGCRDCAYYENEDGSLGECQATCQGDPSTDHPTVEALGMCARWTAGG